MNLWASQVALVVKNPPANAGDSRDVGSIPWVRKIPWRRVWQPTPVFLPGESQGQRSLVAAVLGSQRVPTTGATERAHTEPSGGQFGEGLHLNTSSPNR